MKIIFNTRHFIIFGLVALTFILTVFYYYSNYHKPIGICVFDLDDTITCGLDIAAKSIKRCKELGAIIAINTARPVMWYSDIDMERLGLNNKDMSEFYYGRYYDDISTREELVDRIAETKLKHLETLREKYGIDKNRIILLDDQLSNIIHAKNNGFSTIHANNKMCGLPYNTNELIDEILLK